MNILLGVTSAFYGAADSDLYFYKHILTRHAASFDQNATPVDIATGHGALLPRFAHGSRPAQADPETDEGAQRPRSPSPAAPSLASSLPSPARRLSR